jgi:dienelactone hydrolase
MGGWGWLGRACLAAFIGGFLAWGPVLAQGARPDPESIVPLPAALEIMAPGPDVPASLAAFRGAWVGTWEDEFRNILVVERIAADGRASVVYAWADSAFYGVSRGWMRTEAKIANGVLTIQRFGWTDALAVDGKGRLTGTSTQRTGRVAPGVFARAEPASLAGGKAVVEKVWPGERVRIPHLTLRTPDGARALELEGTLYRPKTEGMAPLAIVTHGSDIGRDLLRSFSYFDLGSWLSDKGYAVLVLMRRGRGLSEGEYGEDFYNTDRNGNVIDALQGLGEAVEDLDSAIAYGRALPFVQKGPVLLVGQSRGGFLAVHYAGLKPNEVMGVINFAGGWMSGRAAVLNTPIFQRAGKSAGSKVKQLWLYAEKDSFYTEDHIRENFNAFRGAGGQVKFEFYRGITGNGHRLLQFPGIWRPAADEFLATLLSAQGVR